MGRDGSELGAGPQCEVDCVVTTWGINEIGSKPRGRDLLVGERPGKPDPSVCDGAQLRERRREGIDTLRDWKDKSLAPQGVAHVSTPTERAIRLFRALAEYEGPVGNGRFRSPRYDSPNRGITRYVGKGLSGLPARPCTGVLCRG